MLGQILTRPFTSHGKKEGDDDERTALLGDNGDQDTRQPTQNKRKKASRPVSWSEVFSPQSSLVLLAYSMLAMHNMAFDSLLPVFLHHPEQDLNGPDVQLPFKFIGGFGVGK